MKILSTTEAAQRLGVTPRRVLALIQAGKLPAQQLGREYAIKEQDLNLVAVRPAGRPKGSGNKPKPEAVSA